jgi:hypothetical protein
VGSIAEVTTAERQLLAAKKGGDGRTRFTALSAAATLAPAAGALDGAQ